MSAFPSVRLIIDFIESIQLEKSCIKFIKYSDLLQEQSFSYLPSPGATVFLWTISRHFIKRAYLKKYSFEILLVFFISSINFHTIQLKLICQWWPSIILITSLHILMTLMPPDFSRGRSIPILCYCRTTTYNIKP